MKTTKIMIVGVGGQGTLLASKILGALCLGKGYDVKVSEVHGMSQRGGSVVTYVCFGDKVYSPIIDKGEADYIISFELLEAGRWVEYLSENGKIITNTQCINPMPVITGDSVYPDTVIDSMNKNGIFVDTINALEIANEMGSSKVVNLVLLGRFSKYLDFSEDEWLGVIENTVPANYLEMNVKAFKAGKNS